MIEKPPHGSPCNSCGQCCKRELCPLGEAIFRHFVGPCEALRYDAMGRSECGLICDPASYVPARAMSKGAAALSRAAAVLVGAGRGCDWQTPGEAPNEGFRGTLATHVASTRKEARRAAITWGIGHMASHLKQ